MKELLFSLGKKDFRIDTFRAGGKGGQHQNKTNSGVRITHLESGAVGESREERSQLQNKRKAFERLVETKEFKIWHRLKCAAAIQGQGEINKMIEQKVEENTKPEYIKTEIRTGSGWEEAVL
jgi:protein subunit release factor B